jgi:hypothetical protein
MIDLAFQRIVIVEIDRVWEQMAGGSDRPYSMIAWWGRLAKGSAEYDQIAWHARLAGKPAPSIWKAPYGAWDGADSAGMP